MRDSVASRLITSLAVGVELTASSGNLRDVLLGQPENVSEECSRAVSPMTPPCSRSSKQWRKTQLVPKSKRVRSEDSTPRKDTKKSHVDTGHKRSFKAVTESALASNYRLYSSSNYRPYSSPLCGLWSVTLNTYRKSVSRDVQYDQNRSC